MHHMTEYSGEYPSEIPQIFEKYQGHINKHALGELFAFQNR